MKSFKVYLAGPITGLAYGASVDWRDEAKQFLSDLSDGRVEGYSPMRSKGDLGISRETVIMDAYEGNILSCERGIMSRDFNDCQTMDAILVNLLGATQRVSIGTVMEIAWAYAFRKPVILAIEPKDSIEVGFNGASGEIFGSNIHEHAMIREAVGFRTDNLQQAIQTCVKVLLP